ncbi:MAG: PAS domain S-box protein [Candidatus Latescibacteria bacterium]|nr:PAS domain S-box protein [Candidatus Latescibacterota bacterium]
MRFIAVTALAAAATGALVWGVTAHVSEGLHQEGRIKVAGLAATIAAGILPEDLAPVGNPVDERGSAHEKLRYHFVAARQANPEVRRIYALRPDAESDTWRYALDVGTSRTGHAGIGDLYRARARSAIGAARRGPAADRGTAHDARGSWIAGYAPVRNHASEVVGIVGVEVSSEAALASERRFRTEAMLAYGLLLVGIVATGFDRYQKRRLTLERNRNIHARLSIHRLAEVMTRTGAESDLVRNALDAIAEGTGYPHWVLHKRDPETGTLKVYAVRGLPDELRRELTADPIAADAASPASRAAFRREAVVTRPADPSPPYSFASRVPGLGGRPVTAAVPLLEHGETTAVLQCFSPRTDGFSTEDVTLIRWMASQLAHGLKRIQLESRDQLLASYMRSTAELLIGFDLDGRITYANAAAERALIESGEDLHGRNVDEIFLLSEIGAGASYLSALRAAGGWAGDVTCLKSDGTRFPAEVTVSMALDREGNPSAWVLVGRDVSERREREYEITSRTEQLELINEQLQQANEKLADANRMKNEFLANTSHELRTPLNAVIGFATLLEQKVAESEEERQSFAKAIRESAEHLLAVINDILDLAKVEAGKLELAVETGDATPTILAAAGTIRSSALRKGLSVTVETPAEPLEMRLDPARMRQILLNLLGNAVKFADKGEVRIRAWREVAPPEIRIVIEDTGIGIAEQDLGRLFVKFSQVDGSYKRRHQGTGLGLVITQSLVQRMGGRISIESDGLGRGTRVTLAFPAVRATAPASRPKAIPTIPAPTGLEVINAMDRRGANT